MATQTTSTAHKAWAPDLSTFTPADVVPDALVMLTSTVTGSVEGDNVAVRVAYIDDASADFVAEAAAIPESDPQLNEVIIYTGKVSQLVRLSREQYYQDGTATSIAASTERAITTRANLAYLAQPAPAAPAVMPAPGLLNVTGILDGGAITDSLDQLADGLGALETNGATPSHILAAPDAWSRLRKLKTASGHNTTLLGAGTSDTEKRLLGIPVITTAAMPTGTLLVLDRTAIVSAVGEVQVATSEHTYFTSDSIAVRATWRFGQNVVRPDRIARFTVTDPSKD